MTRQSWFGAVAALLVAALLVVSSRSISEFVVSFFFKDASQARPVAKKGTAKTTTVLAGQIEKITGAVWVRHRNQKEFYAAPAAPVSLFHLDQIKVAPNSTAHLKMAKGWQIALYENSLATVELYRADTSLSPTLLSVIRGSYQVLNQGERGHLFVMQNKRVFPAESPPPTKVRKAEIATSANLQILRPSLKVPAAKAPHKNAQQPLPSAPEKIQLHGQETLTSSYIEEVLGRHTHDLRRCQMNSLRDGKNAEGSLLLSFTISPKGRVEHIKILKDQIKNEQLINCSASVLERTKFKSFAGLPITLTYPLQFR